MIDKEIFNEAYNQGMKDLSGDNYDTKVSNLKYYLSQKYPHNDFTNHMYLFQLYKTEVEISFSEQVQKRFYRVWKYGPPKSCPINKFIQSPTLF